MSRFPFHSYNPLTGHTDHFIELGDKSDSYEAFLATSSTKTIEDLAEALPIVYEYVCWAVIGELRDLYLERGGEEDDFDYDCKLSI